MKKRAQKKRGVIILILIIIGVFLIYSVLNLDPIKEKTTKIASLVYYISGCEISKRVEYNGVDPFKESKINIEGNRVIINHILEYVCCANLTINSKQENNLIILTEENTGEMCKCICEYGIFASFGPLDPGNYTIQVYGVKYENMEPELLLEKEAMVK